MGLPQPTCLNSSVLSDRWLSTCEIFDGEFQGRKWHAMQLCKHRRSSAEALHATSPQPGRAPHYQVSAHMDEDEERLDLNHCKVLIAN